MTENKLVAKVNGKEISRNDVLNYLNSIGPQMAMKFQSPDGIKRIIHELVNQELLYLDAVKEDLEKNQEFIDVLEATKVNLLKDYAVNRIIADVDASDEEVKEHYDTNKENYVKKETVVASHILIEEEENANAIFDEINQGLSFEEAAGKYSTCPSKEDGGNLGGFTKGQMVKEFEDAAFSMEVDTISQPVKSQFGYHIIKVTDKLPEGMLEFDEVKDQIYNELVTKKKQDTYLEKIRLLKDEYEVEIF